MVEKTCLIAKMAVCLLGLLLLFSTTAYPKIIYVDDDGPADFDNIQAAIDDSNDGDTIIVSPGTYTGAGNRDISYNGKAITVRSEDPNDPNIVAATIINCNGTEDQPHRGFLFNSGEEANSVLAGLTITNGYADYGGGIYCEASRPTITNCNIVGNRTGLNWFSSNGGGISCRFCNLKGPSLPGKASGPYPSDGEIGPPPFISLMWMPGLFAESHDVYFGTTSPPPFIGNQISAIFDPDTMENDTTYYWRVDELNKLGKTIGDEWSFTTGSGLPPPPPPPPLPPPPPPLGALGEQSSTQVLPETDLSGPTIQNCIISDNLALDDGGGMYTQNSKPILCNCTFGDNYTDGSGGGVFAESSNPALVNCSFISNLAFSSGGGLLCADSNTTLTNCSFSGNHSYYEGGGIFNRHDSNTNLTNCIFNDNSAGLRGGGIYNDANSRANLTNCTFTSNKVIYDDPFGNAGGRGGGIYNYHCNSKLINCTFSKNSAYRGGGIYSIFDSNTVLIDCIFKKNSAEFGGGVYSGSSNGILTNCTFIENSAGVGSVTFYWVGGYGGGMYSGGGYSELSNCMFSGNSAYNIGGGMYNAECSPILKNCTFSGNVAEYTGGPIIIPPWPPQPPPVYGFGGAMYNCYSSAKLINCTFAGNRAHEEGGAIWWLYSGPRPSPPPPPTPPPPPHFTGSANTDLGLVENLSITDCNDINVPMISNCIFWDNRDSNGIEEVSQIRVDPNETPITINYSCIQGWTGNLGGTGNIDTDPCFVQPGYWTGSLYSYSVWYEGYYQLLPESLCIDVGDPNYIAEPNETDLDGRPRVIDGRIDMGAYEYQGPGQEKLFYVDDDAVGANNGSSWIDAFNYLQDALAAARYGDQIFVAQGIYKPDRGHRVVSGDQEATFWLRNGLAIIGGYAGANALDPNARNTGLYETILSGDLNGNDVEVLDPCDLLYEPTRAENSYNVVTGSGTNETALLNGFTITAGIHCGLYNKYSSATVNNCTFTDNGGSVYGAAMAHWGSSTVATNCKFASNYCGVHNRRWILNRRSSPILTKCTFSGNSGGGGMINDRRDSILLNCIFNGNISYKSGGGLYNIFSNPILTNCTLSGNWAASFGGGIFNERSYTSLTNCILWGNTIPEGQGQAAQIYGNYHPVINYCCIEGWTGDLGGIGNIGADPLFVEPGYLDVNGVWIDGDYHLLPGSPCIDAGDPDYIPEPNETDLDGRPRVIGGRIDMGAYEFNRIPVADAGLDQTVECACNTVEGTKVTLDGSGSYDADGDPLIFTWTGPFVESPAYGATPTVTLEGGCPGEYVITLIVNNGIEDSEPNDVVITVVDTTPPEFSLSVSPAVLWPPDHKMYEITPSWTVSDECDAEPQVSIVDIVKSEGNDTIGDGHTSDDIQIGDDGSIYLRAERSGAGSDRVYTITCQAVDESGNTTVHSATVSIPHDFKVLAGIASRWLWIKPAGRIPEDLNGDGIVNFTDFAGFAENWIK